jgi:hypothetical protein
MLQSPSPPRTLSVPASAASVPTSLWPPDLSQEQARRKLFAMIMVQGRNGNCHVAIDNIPAFVKLVHSRYVDVFVQCSADDSDCLFSLYLVMMVSARQRGRHVCMQISHLPAQMRGITKEWVHTPVGFQQAVQQNPEWPTLARCAG